MQGSFIQKTAIGTLAVSTGVGFVLLAVAACGTAPTPFLVNGPGQPGNDPPTLTIIEPVDNVTRPQGAPLLIRWNDSDSDDNASISFELIDSSTNARVPLVNGLDENDLIGPDSVPVGTSLIPEGSYFLLGTIDDGVNDPVETFASIGGVATASRVVIRITGEGEGQQSVPPTLTVTEPEFPQSVTQDDILTVTVAPSLLEPIADRPFDPDSNITMFLVLDLDQDPNNDDPANPQPDQIVVLDERTVNAGDFGAITFTHQIDLTQTPARAGGLPYYIRITASDLENPPVHRYAVGTINVNQLASGLVDLAEAGTVISGARFYGFNPGALTGSSITGITDFDADSADDFVIVAKKGNPRNLGTIGEAYLIYGQRGEQPADPGIRFGGSIAVNSVSQSISGVIFEAPPVRTRQIPDSNARTNGITAVSFIRALPTEGGGTDDRPELIFGLSHTHGAFEAMDYDPADEDATGADNTVDVEVELRQGSFILREDDETVDDSIYLGVVDTTIDDATPTVAAGSSSSISWRNDTANTGRSWGLIKFTDVLDFIPDDPAFIEAGSIQAQLRFRMFNTGGNATLHEVFPDFGTLTTYASFATGGGEPIEDVDYDADDLGTISGADANFVTITVSDFVTRLIDGQLRGSNDELRFIIVAGTADGDDDVAIRSSETSGEGDRPRLTISYSRLNLAGELGCYPDELINNRTDTEAVDVQETAGGMVIIVNSTNRDSQPRVNPAPTRLDTTSIALELVGQENFVLSRDGQDDAGNIFVRADDPDGEAGRIAGARFMAGGHDVVDHRLLNQPAREGLFGEDVASLRDVTADGIDEIVISAPMNERHMDDLRSSFGALGTHFASTRFRGSIIVLPGADYNQVTWREKALADDSNSSIPLLDQQRSSPFGSCLPPTEPRGTFIPADAFQVFAEDIDDRLGGASSAGDFNQDGIADILCGANLNDRPGLTDAGAAYVLYGRSVIGDFDLKDADDDILRSPMLRVRGTTLGDQIGWRQVSGFDVNGDRIDDVFISSPRTDFGGVTRATCAREFDGTDPVTDDDLRRANFENCRNTVGEEVFSDDACDAFDYDRDGDIDDQDECIFCCLSDDCEPSADCVHGGDSTNCCNTIVDNGFVGVIFGGVFTDGDRDICQIGTTDLAGAVFYGSAFGHRAGIDVSSAGDFNQDGFGDLLIAVPGEVRADSANRQRQGVVYLIFGGTHLSQVCGQNSTCTGGCSLAEVGTAELPGIVFLSPFQKGRPNEASPITVAAIGDINNDGFDDIAIGNPRADFIDLSFPQGPDAAGDDADVGRRRDAGEAYIIYGNNFGSNRGG